MRAFQRKSVALLLGVMVSGCTDRPAGPTAIADRNLTLDRGGAEWEPATTITGTGDPAIDVAAVQAAVDQGGRVVLKGHFSFEATPSAAIAPDLPPALPQKAEVKITKSVTISGPGDDEDEMTTIDGGTLPFYIEAPGQAVTIRGLRFIRPISHAILVFAVRGLEITSTRVEGLRTFKPNVNGVIGIYTVGGIPNPANPGKPGNVAGDLVIADNDFDVAGGTTAENVLGITVFSVGDSEAPVHVRVSRNRIRNTTEPAINFRRVVGQVTIDHNVLNTGAIGVPDARSQVIRVANLGSYVIAHNAIDCAWAGVADAEGIGVFSQISAWPIEHATVEHNRVTMSPSQGTTLGPFSAAIGVYGFANANVVRYNVIRGVAQAGIAMPVFPLTPPVASPRDNALVRNNFRQFTPTLADIFVGANAVNTLIVGRGSVVDESKVP